MSLPLRTVDLVDSLWSLMILLRSGVYSFPRTPLGARAWLVLALVAAWSLRLAVYLTWRNHGHAEDRHYQAIRRNNDRGFAWKSLYIIFGLQAALAWIISLPLLAAATSISPLGALDGIGTGLWLVGLLFEAGGDLQLARFKRDPANAGKVMDRGLWHYTRHPNYFGDFCIWWGFFAIALAGGGWWSIVGVTLLEKDIAERRPEYQGFIRRTPAFIPGRPRDL